MCDFPVSQDHPQLHSFLEDNIIISLSTDFLIHRVAETEPALLMQDVLCNRISHLVDTEIRLKMTKDAFGGVKSKSNIHWVEIEST